MKVRVLECESERLETEAGDFNALRCVDVRVTNSELVAVPVATLAGFFPGQAASCRTARDGWPMRRLREPDPCL